MGGRALLKKGITTQRHTTEQLNKVCLEILPLIKKHLGVEYYVVKSYTQKPDHGDLDILIRNENEKLNTTTVLLPFITNVLNASTYVKNSNVLSFDYDTIVGKLHVDFIITKDKDWVTATNFFDYNDRGNFFGKIAYQYGLRYGHQGLRFKYYPKNSDKLLGEFVVCKEPQKIFAFLGFEYNKVYDNQEMLWEDVINNPIFHPDIFLVKENQSYDHRKRNKRRPGFQKFIAYLEKLKNQGRFDDYPEYKREYGQYFDLINSFFPECNFNDKLKDIRDKEAIRTEIVSKFNGRMLIDNFGIVPGPEVGKALSKLHDSAGGKEQWNEFVYITPVDVLYEHIKSVLNV